MMIACDADASMTSDSLIAPDAGVDDAEPHLGLLDLVERRPPARPTEPCTSPLMMMLSSLSPPSLMRAKRSSSVTRPAVRQLLGAEALVALAGHLAGGPLVLDHPEASPASTTPPRPRTSTGIDGPAVSSGCAVVVDHRADAAEARCRPRSTSPTCSVPRCTSTEATGPRPGSRRASMTAPDASGFGLAFSSASASATSSTVSSSVSMPVPSRAETFTNSCVAAPLRRDDVALGELLLDAVRVGAGLVHLVDGDDDRHARRPWRGRSPPSSAA